MTSRLVNVFLEISDRNFINGLVGPLLVPQDYDDLLSYYTKRGYRVIAVAGKSIEGLSWLKAQRMKRCH